MRNIDISLMIQNITSSHEDEFFNTFVSQCQIGVNRTQIAWSDSWNQLLQFGLNTQGSCPDLSEIGTTWLGSFHAMEALRPFTNQEIAMLGGSKQFASTAWQACLVEPGPAAFGIPWKLDIRIVIYRRDWLQKAGVDEASAFCDAAHFRETLHSLQAAGHQHPLGITTAHTVTRMLHDLASWVWDAGGEIRSQDGRKMLLHRPESLIGLESYFGLNEFLSPETQAQEQPDVFNSFLAGKTAVAIGSDLNYFVLRRMEPSDVTDNLGLAVLMKAPFIGGTALSIWRSSLHIEESLKLIQYLTGIEAGQVLYEHYLSTPANLNAIENSTLLHDPYYPIIQKSLQSGKSFHTGYRWGGVEARLIPVIEQLWRDLQTNPTLNIKFEVEKRFTDLSDRLEKTILAIYA